MNKHKNLNETKKKKKNAQSVNEGAGIVLSISLIMS